MKKLPFLAAAAALVATASVAYAIVTFDPITGAGFVGKGDVQLVYGWNNQALQANEGSVMFRATSVSTTEWTCSRINPAGKEVVVNRNQTATSQGLVSSTARRNSSGINGPVTGFNLNGYDGGEPTIVEDGHALGSCPPAGGNPFEHDGNEETTQGATVVQVSNDGGATWFDLL
jgi:hypothetical protein